MMIRPEDNIQAPYRFYAIEWKPKAATEWRNVRWKNTNGSPDPVPFTSYDEALTEARKLSETYDTRVLTWTLEGYWIETCAPTSP